jgi:hypothetical protein
MHGFVEAGTCRNWVCGEVGPRHEDGYCSEDCRIGATGCAVPFCGCRGADLGLRQCMSCTLFVRDLVDGTCAECRVSNEAEVGS